MTTTPAWGEAPPELLRLRAEIGRSLPGLEVQLEPLSEAETRQLVYAQSPWCADDDERERLARRVFFETGGNPFLVSTLLRALADASSLRAEVLAWPPHGETDESPLPISVPQLARRAITASVARLDEQTRRVLQAATIGAVAIDVGLVAALTGLPRAAVEDALAALERARLVTFEGHRYAVAAPLIAQVVLAEWLLPGERRGHVSFGLPVNGRHHDSHARPPGQRGFGLRYHRLCQCEDSGQARSHGHDGAVQPLTQASAVAPQARHGAAPALVASNLAWCRQEAVKKGAAEHA